MTIDNVSAFLRDINVSDLGTTYLFGSFARSKGKQYNDIDVYIDASCDVLESARIKFENMDVFYRIVPQYYTKLPIPKPVPPPKEINYHRLLGVYKEFHVTLCPVADARNQAFFASMLAGEYLRFD